MGRSLPRGGARVKLPGMNTNRTVIVTGAAQGIGNAIARGFAAEGATVVVADRQGSAQAAAAIPSAIGHDTDVADTASVDAMAAAVLAQTGRIDVLVNNAGIFTALLPGPLEEIDPLAWRRVMAVNVDGIFHTARAVVPVMKRQGPREGGYAILHIGSATAFKGNPLMLHYVTSKAAVLGLTRSMARELGPHGIRVNNLAPGYTLSEGMLANDVQLKRGRQKNIDERAVKRDMMPADLVGAALFLCGSAAGFITGQTLVVDGGVFMH